MRHRGAQAEKERRIRSRMRFLLKSKGMLRGSLLTLETKCGKSGCRCARGEKHRLVVIEQSRRGKTRMRTVPAGLKREVEEWVRNYQEFRELLEALSELNWEKLEERKREK